MSTRNKVLTLAGVVAALVLSAILISSITQPQTIRLTAYNGVIKSDNGTQDAKRSKLYVRASKLLQAGDAPRAEAVYREIVAQYPNESESYSCLGACLYFQTNYTDAEVQYKRALELDSRSVQALYGLGCLAYEQNHDQEAIDYLNRALAVEPKNGLCHWVLGCVYEHMGNATNALSYYERAVALDPSLAGDPVIRQRIKALK